MEGLGSTKPGPRGGRSSDYMQFSLLLLFSFLKLALTYKLIIKLAVWAVTWVTRRQTSVTNVTRRWQNHSSSAYIHLPPTWNTPFLLKQLPHLLKLPPTAPLFSETLINSLRCPSHHPHTTDVQGIQETRLKDSHLPYSSSLGFSSLCFRHLVKCY